MLKRIFLGHVKSKHCFQFEKFPLMFKEEEIVIL